MSGRMIQTNHGPISEEDLKFLQDLREIADGIVNRARRCQQVAEQDVYASTEVDKVVRSFKVTSTAGRLVIRMHLARYLRHRVRAALGA